MEKLFLEMIEAIDRQNRLAAENNQLLEELIFELRKSRQPEQPEQPKASASVDDWINDFFGDGDFSIKTKKK